MIFLWILWFIFPSSILSDRVWCSSNSGCQISEDNLLAVNKTVADEVSCQACCVDTASCQVYSWFQTGECWLFASCDLPDLTCDCWTGPKECPATSSSDPQTSSSVSSCQVPAEKENGDWFCRQSEEILTCFLESDPGYAAAAETKTICSQGSWSRPVEDIRCSSTIALVTGGLEWGPLQSVEVYGTNLSPSVDVIYSSTEYLYMHLLVRAECVHCP